MSDHAKARQGILIILSSPSGAGKTTLTRGLRAWDPTLAFVMGGAIVPMFIAWRLTEGRKPLVGGDFPAPPEPKIGRPLVVGSVLFGMGWGLAGLCPGPAIASVGFGGWPVWVFFAAMLAGMLIAPKLRDALDSGA